jgi:hypothetical protein
MPRCEPAGHSQCKVKAAGGPKEISHKGPSGRLFCLRTRTYHALEELIGQRDLRLSGCGGKLWVFERKSFLFLEILLLEIGL